MLFLTSATRQSKVPEDVGGGIIEVVVPSLVAVAISIVTVIIAFLSAIADELMLVLLSMDGVNCCGHFRRARSVRCVSSHCRGLGAVTPRPLVVFLRLCSR